MIISHYDSNLNTKYYFHNDILENDLESLISDSKFENWSSRNCDGQYNVEES